MADTENRLQELVAEVAAAYFSNSPTSPTDIPHVISQIAASLGAVGAQPVAADVGPPPAVEGSAAAPAKATAAQIRKSITPEALISFEDGKPYKTLKRHLSTRGLTVEQYREKWGLPADYPTVSPNYSAARSQMAISLGLGQKGRGASKAPRKGRGKT